MKAKRITLITGLPGAGKTTLSKKFSGQVIHLDDHDPKKPLPISSSAPSITIEGLLSGPGFQVVLDKIKRRYLKSQEYRDTKAKLDIQIIPFEEDREACLHNDMMRDRELKADITIRHMTLDIPSREELEESYPMFRFTILKPRPVQRA